MVAMNSRSFVLADVARIEQLLLIGTSRRLLDPHSTWVDDSGVPWCGRRIGRYWFAVSSLGPGWVYDPHAQSRRGEELENLRRRVGELNETNVGPHFESSIASLNLGNVCERMFWAVHERIIQSKRSVVRVPDVWLADRVWDGRRRPRHWRGTISEALKSLAWLHLGEGGDDTPAFGPETAVVTHAADLRRSAQNDCDVDCPLRGDRQHHHFLVNIGKGFLGVLERCATREEAGTRHYAFPARGSRSTGMNLTRLGRTGRLTSLYNPARLGSRVPCRSLSASEHGLLQVLVRERTRKRRRTRREFSELEILSGNRIVDLSGRGEIVCPFLDANGRYVSFNGNKKRRGCGYLLLSQGGWTSKAGRSTANVELFLRDLAHLSRELGLIVVGLRSNGRQIQWFNLDQLQAVADSRAADTLQRVHVRVYADENCFSRWDEFFGWPPADSLVDEEDLNARAELQSLLRLHSVSRKTLAVAIGKDASTISKILNGQRRCTAQFRDEARRAILDVTPPNPSSGLRSHSSSPAACPEPHVAYAAASDYRRRGWSVIPQRPSTKRPYVRWKAFQSRLPTWQEFADWWRRFPDAGIAVICGPLSGILVVDVDGPEAAEALIRRLGSEPLTPKALSGSGDPNRYHLFFQHPDFQTRAKATPWHARLEFRGHAGLAVLPPSLHTSGNLYCWAPGRSLSEVSIPILPPEIANALRPAANRTVSERAVSTVSRAADVSPSTAEFLAGRYANGPRWNDRLFRAGCDLAARNVPLIEATRVLLHGACPRDLDQQDAVIRTIQSAYSQPRVPAVL
jgi:hypothetical protein